MIINHNLNAMNAHRQMGTNLVNNGKSIEKLSSGLRINRAGDDAAGLAISEKMRGQIRGLEQASRNAQDSISLIQTAEGALNETHSILQRMRELAVQSSSDTNSSVDRGSIQKEIDQLTSEIDRIATTTEFNTKKLLNGGASVTANKAGADAADITILGGSADTKVGAVVTLSSGFNVATADNSTITVSTMVTVNTLMTAASSITLNGISFSFTTSDTVQNVLDRINDANIGVVATHDALNAKIDFASTTVGSKSNMDIASATGTLAGAETETQGVDAVLTTALVDGANATYTAEGDTITIQSGKAKGLQFKLSGGSSAATDNSITIATNGGLNMQIGANEGQSMYASISDMRGAALGVNAIDVTTAAAASAAITTINNAIESVSSERSKLGAYQNRLDHTINNLNASAENLQASESRIRDVDMAKEMMTYSKTNILSQAAQAMLAQANQAPQGVLQLLR
ncbi:MAG: flagellin N-terminal helical domain-containing protein [Clostridia bacterium]